METLWESLEEEHHLSLPLPLSVPIISSHSNRDKSAQTEEVLGFSLSLRQLQAVTQAKDQLEWGLRSLASAPKIKMYPCHRNLATVFAVWLGVT